LGLLQIILMHPDQPHTSPPCFYVARQITTSHLLLVTAHHTKPVACSINLNTNSIHPIVKVNAPLPKLQPDLVAPSFTMLICLQQLHEFQLIAGDQSLASCCPHINIIHAKGAPQVRNACHNLWCAVPVVLLLAAAPLQLEEQLVLLL
jgi:hypothetical protein